MNSSSESALNAASPSESELKSPDSSEPRLNAMRGAAVISPVSRDGADKLLAAA